MRCPGCGADTNPDEHTSGSNACPECGAELVAPRAAMFPPPRGSEEDWEQAPESVRRIRHVLPPTGILVREAEDPFGRRPSSSRPLRPGSNQPNSPSGEPLPLESSSSPPAASARDELTAGFRDSNAPTSSRAPTSDKARSVPVIALLRLPPPGYDGPADDVTKPVSLPEGFEVRGAAFEAPRVPKLDPEPRRTSTVFWVIVVLAVLFALFALMQMRVRGLL